MIIALLAATVLLADSTTAMQSAPSAASAPAAVAPAANAPPAGAADGKQKLAAGNTVICRNEAVLGSRLPTRRCRTAIQAAEERRESQEAVDKLQRLDNPGNKN